MSFFFTEKKFNSSINGEIILRRYWWGYWFLIPLNDTWYQSGSYLEKMWQKILTKSKKENFFPKNILTLGLGAGCVVNEINKIWGKKTHIDAVDYDPIMIEAAKTAYKNQTFLNTKFIIGDASDFVKKSDGKKYDLIVIDLFCGSKPSPLLRNESFIENINRIVKKQGFIVLNFDMTMSRDREIPEIWRKYFPGLAIIKYKTNSILTGYALKIPDDYYNFQQSEAWAGFLQKRGWKILGKPRSYTYIQRLPLNLCISNAIHTDSEPDMDSIKNLGCKHGIIFWSPWEKQSAPNIWKRWPTALHSRGNGLTTVKENYRQDWNERAKRCLKKFESFAIKIEETGPEKFTKWLQRSTLKKFLRKSFASAIKRMEHAPIIFWVAKKNGSTNSPKDEKILGGLAIINYSEISSHFVAFITREGKKFQIGTGLINFWHQYALKNNIKYLNFGYVRRAGEPKSWQGYTDFKKNFIGQNIYLPNGYFRIF